MRVQVVGGSRSREGKGSGGTSIKSARRSKPPPRGSASILPSAPELCFLSPRRASLSSRAQHELLERGREREGGRGSRSERRQMTEAAAAPAVVFGARRRVGLAAALLLVLVVVAVLAGGGGSSATALDGLR